MYFLEDIIANKHGECRHHSLFLAFLLGEYFKHNLSNISVHHSCDDWKNPGEGHAWVVCKENNKLFLIDSMFDKLCDLSEYKDYLLACRTYSETIINRTLNRANLPSIQNKTTWDCKLFSPALENTPPLTCVVQGNLKEILSQIKRNLSLLFEKGQVTDPCGRTFYDVSVYQLVTLLCDDDMKKHIMPFIHGDLIDTRRAQYTEISYGGAGDAFKASFNDMENNSSRRSSDVEHKLIAKLLQRQLQRQGIQYEQHGIRYRDNRDSFKLIDAYRTSIRFLNEGKEEGNVSSFHPLPLNFNGFRREMRVSNYYYGWLEVFKDRKLSKQLELDFL